MTMKKIMLEVCAADIESVKAAANGGADRVELCFALTEGGLTPSIGMIDEALKVQGIKVNVLIRPRCGDFVYSEAEIRVMIRDIEACKKLGVNGVVFGALTPAGDIDIEACRRMAASCGELHKTFHRAFDMCRDPHIATHDIISLGFDRILTSGQARTALEGSQLICKLQHEFPEIIFIAAGGVSPGNVSEIISRAGISEVHASAKTIVHSSMTYRNPGVCMGSPDADEYSRQTTDTGIVKLIQRSMINDEL